MTVQVTIVFHGAFVFGLFRGKVHMFLRYCLHAMV